MFNKRKKRIAALEIIVADLSSTVAMLEASNHTYGMKLHNKNNELIEAEAYKAVVYTQGKKIELLEAELGIMKKGNDELCLENDILTKTIRELHIAADKLELKHEGAMFNLSELRKLIEKEGNTLFKLEEVKIDNAKLKRINNNQSEMIAEDKEKLVGYKKQTNYAAANEILRKENEKLKIEVKLLDPLNFLVGEKDGMVKFKKSFAAPSKKVAKKPTVAVAPSKQVIKNTGKKPVTVDIPGRKSKTVLPGKKITIKKKK